jgi:hypothetical protein
MRFQCQRDSAESVKLLQRWLYDYYLSSREEDCNLPVKRYNACHYYIGSEC